MDAIKNEIISKQLFKNDLNDISVCDKVNCIAVAGENCIKIIDKKSYEEIINEKKDIRKSAGSISKISWSKKWTNIISFNPFRKFLCFKCSY